MKRYNTWMLVEASIMIGISIVLGEFVKIFKMPMGGSVTAGSMVPLLLFSYRWGGKKGILAGTVYGILDLIIGGLSSIHPFALIFDYPLAYAMIGIAGFFKKNPVGLIGGVFTGMAGRFICHVLSGVVAYSSYAPEGQSPWVYSILYNGTFLLPEFFITVVLLLLMLKFIKLPEPKLDNSKSIQ